MEDERISRALARIEAAARRVEAAASRMPTSKPDPDLVARHEKLKAEASAALTEMDRLIGTLER